MSFFDKAVDTGSGLFKRGKKAASAAIDAAKEPVDAKPAHQKTEEQLWQEQLAELVKDANEGDRLYPIEDEDGNELGYAVYEDGMVVEYYYEEDDAEGAESADTDSDQPAKEIPEGYEEIEITEDDIVSYLVDEEGNQIGFVVMENGEEVEYVYPEDEIIPKEETTKDKIQGGINTTKEVVGEVTGTAKELYAAGMGVVAEYAPMFNDLSKAINTAGKVRHPVRTVKQEVKKAMDDAAKTTETGAAASGGEWTCECGAKAKGKFCGECGKPAPAPAAAPAGEWTCQCGTKNTGKFCGECGAAAPASAAAQSAVPAEWDCSCGAHVKGKFCGECGTSYADGHVRKEPTFKPVRVKKMQ